MRDAVAHTALLTDAAKNRLATVRENIKGKSQDDFGKDRISSNQVVHMPDGI